MDLGRQSNNPLRLLAIAQKGSIVTVPKQEHELKELHSDRHRIDLYDDRDCVGGYDASVQCRNIDCINRADPNGITIDGLIWNEQESTATMINQNLWQIPIDLIEHYAPRIRKLDLSYNCLQTLTGIEYFSSLEELILDNNQLDDNIRFYSNSYMKILSINKNKLTDLDSLVNEINLKFPNLFLLSILGNSCCPDQLSSSDHDDRDYHRYRSYVIYRLPQLRFLDSTPVRAYERIDAQKRGRYHRLVRLNSDPSVEIIRQNHQNLLRNSDCRRSELEQSSTPLPYRAENELPKGAFGKLRHRYTGKHSEGNRFIRNNQL
ncbi:hypothetical protein NH340_JMT00729 [Sarcoptes scabiei]|nr:hypothetical protein NH340_JMT00729 [Sarcoptes scabiei]